MRATSLRLALACSLFAMGCQPALGECDEPLARALVFDTDTGSPSYAGQALVERNCGANAFCHAADSAAPRFGAPAGLDFDMRLADTAAETEVLRRGQLQVYRHRHSILDQVLAGDMPPGAAGRGVVDQAPVYDGLPELDSPAGRAVLRNWLACGSPVVERTSPRLPDVEPVGAVVLPPCASGLMGCGELCVDPRVDPSNCGTCGNVCATGSSCVGGACECAAGLSACGADCVDTNADGAHCGGCDSVCPAGQVCSAGACLAGGCPAGTSECAGACVDVTTSAAHCGGCDMDCAAGSACDGGSCSCGSGLTSCDGACVDTATSIAHCGGCGNVCPAGSPCDGGVCVCTGGLTACGAGCVDMTSDPNNCGGCDVTCSAGQRCEAASCAACGSGVTFSGDIQPILTTSCAVAMCHAGRRPAANMSLEAGSAHGALVSQPSDCTDGRPRVTPGAPGDSYLVNKLTGIGMCKGGSMPLRSPSLPTAQLDLIRDWICAGAADD